jgi:hypothetical protein
LNKKKMEEAGQQHEVPDVTGRVIFHGRLNVTYTRQALEATDRLASWIFAPREAGSDVDTKVFWFDTWESPAWTLSGVHKAVFWFDTRESPPGHSVVYTRLTLKAAHGNDHVDKTFAFNLQIKRYRNKLHGVSNPKRSLRYSHCILNSTQPREYN